MFKKTVITLLAVGIFVVPALAEFEVMHNEYGSMAAYGYTQVREIYVFTPDGVDPISTFSVKHARIGLKGKAYEFGSYNVLYDVAAGNLAYAFGRLDFAPIGIEMGLFKTPFGLEFAKSDDKNLTATQAMVTMMLPQYQIGLTLDAMFTFGDFGWVKPALTVYNGTGPVADFNSDKDLMFGLYANPINMEFFKDFQIFGGYVMEYPGGFENAQFGGGLGLDSPAFTVAGEYYSTTYAQGDPGEVTDAGYYAQGSYRWYTGLDWLHAVEPLVRYEVYDPNSDADDDSRNIITPGVNMHFAELHRFKFQINYRMIKDEVNDVDDDEVIGQLSIMY
ncbi:MAG: hypothetical protein GY771_14320 [bacterium]|nr:hypothetical protein [bacterium]